MLQIIISFVVGVKVFSYFISLSTVKNMNSEPIERIKIKPLISSLREFEINDKESIDLIVKYFNDIHPIMTMKHINFYAGGGDFFEFSYNDGKIKTIAIVGHMFMVINKKFVTEIPYEEALEFERILGEVLINHYRSNKSMLEIEGKVISISTDKNTNKRIKRLTLEKTDGSTADVIVDVDNSYSFHMTGSYMEKDYYVNIFADRTDSSDIPIADIAIITQNGVR